MAWLFKSDWVTNPRNPTNADLDNIWKDQRTWGGNVDAGGYNLFNLASLTTNNSALVGGAHYLWLAWNTPVSGAGNVMTDTVPLVLGTNSTEKMRITVSGNVGVGTASPVEKFSMIGGNMILDFFADAGSTEYLAQHGIFFRGGFSPLGGSGGTEANRRNASITSGRGSGNLGDAIDFNGYHHLSFFTSGAEAVRIQGTGGTAGFVGIGSTSPSYQLHVAGNGQGSSSGNYDDGGTKYGAVFIDDTVAGGYQGGALVFGCGGKRFAAIKGNYQDSASNGVGWLQILIRKVNTDTMLVPVVTISNTGNIGIGTQGPLGQLSLGNPSTDITVKSWSASYDQGNIAFYQARDFPSAGFYGRVLDISAGGQGQGGWIRFLTNPTSGGTTLCRMIITNDGRVGIGNSSPQAALQIGGVGGSLDTDVFLDRATSANLGRLIFSVGGSGVAGGAWGVQAKYDATFSHMFGITNSGFGNPLFQITGTGLVVLQTNPSGDDRALGNSQHLVWYDEGGNRLVFRVRSSGGVLKTGYVNVS